MIKWTGPNRHRSFVGHRIWRAYLGKVVVALIEQQQRQEEAWDRRYETTFTLPVGRPMDWSDTGRDNNINGHEFKTLDGAKANVNREVGKWIKRAGLREQNRTRRSP